VIRFRKWTAAGGLGSDQPGATRAYSCEVEITPGSVNGRTCKLWRPDRRYPGFVTVYRDTESGGAVLEFDALRHGAKEPRLREVVAPEHVDKLILSLLEIRGGEWLGEES
jgi:hypothetical protein